MCLLDQRKVITVVFVGLCEKVSRYIEFFGINFGNNSLSLNHCSLHLTNLKILGGLIVVELLLKDKFSLILGQFFHWLLNWKSLKLVASKTFFDSLGCFLGLNFWFYHILVFGLRRKCWPHNIFVQFSWVEFLVLPYFGLWSKEVLALSYMFILGQDLLIAYLPT